MANRCGRGYVECNTDASNAFASSDFKRLDQMITETVGTGGDKEAQDEVMTYADILNYIERNNDSGDDEIY